jgi:predicted protein tyrosine phosphatase
MPVLYVCSLAEVARHAEALRPAHMVSLLGEEAFPQTPPGIAVEQHLRLRVHDIAEPAEGYIAPAEEHVRELITFGQAWDRASPVIVHCFAGISRSTAAALTLMALHNPGQEAAAARLLRERARHAQPNRRMIALADRLLGARGRLVEAVAAIGPGDFVNGGHLVELPAKLP